MLTSRRAIIGLVAVLLLVLGAAWLLLPPRPGGDAVEAQLRQAAEQLRPFPRLIDEATEMTDARAEGRRMIYVYRVLREEAFDAAAQEARLRRAVCTTAEMRDAIRAHGVSFGYEYRAGEDAARVLARFEFAACD